MITLLKGPIGTGEIGQPAEVGAAVQARVRSEPCARRPQQRASSTAADDVVTEERTTSLGAPSSRTGVAWSHSVVGAPDQGSAGDRNQSGREEGQHSSNERQDSFASRSPPASDLGACRCVTWNC